jgi:SAM-dependent methyltransferase
LTRQTKTGPRPARPSELVGEAVWHDLECGAYSADMPLWTRLAAAVRRQSGNTCDVLELGCGTGRVSLALAKAGCRVTAIDLDSEMVEVLRRRAAESQVPVDARVDDARTLVLGKSFDLVLAPMQLAQLLDEDGRLRMLSSIARHLHVDGRAAIALLDLDEEWDAQGDEAPPPDVLEQDNWVYSSQPVAVRRTGGGIALELDRVRRAVSPTGGLTETFHRICLELVSPPQLEEEARRVGFLPQGRRHVPATSEHVASTVVVLEPSTHGAGRPRAVSA